MKRVKGDPFFINVVGGFVGMPSTRWRSLAKTWTITYLLLLLIQ